MSTVAIIGKPNSGKSLLFNQITGLKQKVANYPGITIDIKKGQKGGHSFWDFPGTYTFEPVTTDEKVAVEKFIHALDNKDLDCVLCVLDATNLRTSLRLGLEVQYEASQRDIPVVFALNMMDELQKNKLTIDVVGLSKAIDADIIPISARTGFGLDELTLKLNSDLKTQVIKAFDYNLKSKELVSTYGFKDDILIRKKNQMDRFFLSGFWGAIVFLSIMLLLFQSIFTWASPFMDLIDSAVSGSGTWMTQNLPEGIFNDFVNEAIFGGIGSFVIFVPQIFFLTFIIGLLEDSGYLARAAVICHRPLKLFGLSGKSFIPLLSGHACAIPAILAARTVESPKKRWLTMLVVPLMGCSARLPVYALLIAAVIPAQYYLGGFFGLQGMAFFMIYAFGIFVALIASAILSKTVYKSASDLPFVLEMPNYRWPHWKPLLRKSFQSSWLFIKKSGLIIFVVTVVVWVLGYFPNGSGYLDTSILASLGRAIEPGLEPLGLDWKYGVAILASFLAREVFVGTLGTLFGIEDAGDNVEGLVTQVQQSGLSLASGISLLVFYAIAMQCVATLAVLKKEVGNLRVPTLIFLGYGVLAYLLAWISYSVLSFLI